MKKEETTTTSKKTVTEPTSEPLVTENVDSSTTSN